MSGDIGLSDPTRRQYSPDDVSWSDVSPPFPPALPRLVFYLTLTSKTVVISTRECLRMFLIGSIFLILDMVSARKCFGMLLIKDTSNMLSTGECFAIF